MEKYKIVRLTGAEINGENNVWYQVAEFSVLASVVDAVIYYWLRIILSKVLGEYCMPIGWRWVQSYHQLLGYRIKTFDTEDQASNYIKNLLDDDPKIPRHDWLD